MGMRRSNPSKGKEDMNERIRELATKARLLTGWPVGEVEYQKFALLIVRECLYCCDRVISDPVSGAREKFDTFEQGGLHCIEEIKQHFGVEE